MTRSLFKSLYKSGLVVIDSGDARIIDNNALVEQKIEQAMQEMPYEPQEDAYEEEEDPAIAALFDTDEEGGEAGTESSAADESGGSFHADDDTLPGGNISGDAPHTAQDSVQSGRKAARGSKAEHDALLAEIEQARHELSDIQAQTDALLKDANDQAEEIRKKAYEEAKAQGYQDGESAAQAEFAQAKKDLEEERKRLLASIEKEEQEIEPRVVEALTGVYEHIFHVDLSRYGSLIVTLLSNTLHGIEGTKSFLVHVSKEDYEAVMNSKSLLQGEAGGGSLEIVEDMTLAQASCLIETENGVYDCSLDTQLSELSRKLKLLSYQG